MALSLRTALAGVSLALAASIAIHVARWPRAATEHGAAPTTTVTVTAAGTTTLAPIDPGACSTQPGECRAESWRVVGKSIPSDARQRTVKPRTADPGTGPGGAAGAVDQHRVLCDI